MIKTQTDIKTESIITGKVPPRMKDTYAVRVKEVRTKNSAKGNFQMEWESEIVEPLVKEFDGEKYAMDSFTLRWFIPLRVYDGDVLNLEETDKRLAAIIGKKPGDDCLHARLGLPCEIDDENPNTKQYVGLVFDAIVGSQERKPQKSDGKGGYTAITRDGKPIVQGWEIGFLNIEDILGLHKGEVKPTGQF